MIRQLINISSIYIVNVAFFFFFKKKPLATSSSILIMKSLSLSLACILLGFNLSSVLAISEETADGVAARIPSHIVKLKASSLQKITGKIPKIFLQLKISPNDRF